MKRILIIEDERPIAESIAFNLEREGYRVETTSDGRVGLQTILSSPPDLVILDLMLPGLDGIEVCRRVRAAGLTTPIIILTAREAEADRVLGLEMGADDYVTKPFSLRELLARVRSVLRRSEMAAAAPIVIDDRLRIDLEGREVTVAGKPVELSAKEFDLLQVLVRHRGQVLSREQLLDLVWGRDFFGDPRTVDVHIRWLREKIEPDPGNPTFILTVRGSGYKFRR
ncbi:MAG: response regulator transcription factor [Firmicutes bacterium]|nr:response regulator transcription factor [Bacillota bacterium]